MSADEVVLTTAKAVAPAAEIQNVPTSACDPACRERLASLRSGTIRIEETVVVDGVTTSSGVLIFFDRDRQLVHEYVDYSDLIAAAQPIFTSSTAAQCEESVDVGTKGGESEEESEGGGEGRECAFGFILALSYVALAEPTELFVLGFDHTNQDVLMKATDYHRVQRMWAAYEEEHFFKNEPVIRGPEVDAGELPPGWGTISPHEDQAPVSHNDQRVSFLLLDVSDAIANGSGGAAEVDGETTWVATLPSNSPNVQSLMDDNAASFDHAASKRTVTVSSVVDAGELNPPEAFMARDELIAILWP